MAESKLVTILLVPEGADAKYSFHMRWWLLKTIVISIVLILFGIVLFFSFYGTVLTRAAMTDSLKKENEALRRYKYKVGLLEENLIQAREVVSRLTSMAGIEYEFPDFPSDSTIFSQITTPPPAFVQRLTTQDWTQPEGLPVQGFITQEFHLGEDEHFHPGVDIACAVGTSVLATGSGYIEYAGYDSTYGYMLVVKHNDSVKTIYGHNEKLLVQLGEAISVGSRIALTGNTGISTAPHLHYEVRVNDKPINPLGMMYEEN